MDDHSSRINVAVNLKQSTQIAMRERIQALKPSYSYSTLLQIGFFQVRVTTKARELLPRVFTLAYATPSSRQIKISWRRLDPLK
jgi:hypothetical protein